VAFGLSHLGGEWPEQSGGTGGGKELGRWETVLLGLDY
jgi:hypothetical protein